MKPFISIIVVGISLLKIVIGVTDTLVGITACIPGSSQTAFPACDYFVNITNVCGSFDKQSRLTCLCNQPTFDSIFNCESEYRLCLESNYIDNELQYAADSWHSFCDTYIKFQPTTPALSTLTTTWDPLAGCLTAEAACESARSSVDKCSTLTTDAAKSSSCICQPDILRWQYTCDYVGNITCFATGATLSSVLGYDYCDNFMQVIGALTSMTDVMTVTLPSSTSTSQASPGGTTPTSSTPAPTSPTTKASASRVLAKSASRIFLLILYGFIIL